MPLTPYFQKALLDWCFGGAAVTQPTARFIGFATASPTSQSDFEGAWQTRISVRMAGANSPQGSVTNNTNVGTPTCIRVGGGTALGFNIWDAGAAGTRLMYGTCTAAIGCKSSADQILIAAGSLTITIS